MQSSRSSQEERHQLLRLVSKNISNLAAYHDGITNPPFNVTGIEGLQKKKQSKHKFAELHVDITSWKMQKWKN